MTDYNYRVFKEDYDNLTKYRSNKKLWNKVLRSRYKEAPDFKENYEAVKFDYITYKDTILADSNIDYAIHSTTDDEIKEGLKLFYGTDTYIGFIVEELFSYKLSEAGVTIVRSDYLDRVKKTDLIANDRAIQIKNISFFNQNDFEYKLNDFFRANNNLFFVFYQQNEDDIFLTTINNYPFTHISMLNDIRYFKNVKLYSINDYIQKHTQ